jgi:hypothetical protein
MVDELDIGLRLLAHLRQKPMLRVSSNPRRIGDEECRMVAAFVRMGGESSPWGVAWKTGSGKMEFRFAPEPRNRAAVQDMLLDFAQALDCHFEDGELDLPQLFLPGPTHVDMLHFLAIRHARGTIGDPATLAILQRMGRRCYQLFDATKNRNRTHCLDMTSALRDICVFPCEPAREAHLGLLVAWLSPGNREAAARKAEAMPVSTSIDPELERRIQPEIKRHHRGEAGADAKIGAILEAELARRIDLTIRAVELAAVAVDENPGVDRIIEASRGEIARFSEHEAQRTPVNVNGGPGLTGHVLADASGFVSFEADQIAAHRSLVPHDRVLQAKLIDSGSGIEGMVHSIARRVVGRSPRIQVELNCRADILVRFRVGDKLVATTAPATETDWQVEAIEQFADHRRIRLISIKGLPIDLVPGVGTPGMRFCNLEEAGLKTRLLAKLREASADEGQPPTPGQWILERLQAGTESGASAAPDELDLTGAELSEADDAAD